MINLSMIQALYIWDQLRDCLEGTNSYGGDTAEIYAFQLMQQHKPGGNAQGYGEEEEFQIAASLTNILQHFCTQNECAAMIECSGTNTPGGTVRIFSNKRGGSIPPFSHRAHVKIEADE